MKAGSNKRTGLLYFQGSSSEHPVACSWFSCHLFLVTEMSVSFQTLCSSSSGNCLRLWTRETMILIDCGVKAQCRCRELLDRHVPDSQRLAAVVVTHSHSDHIGYPAMRVLLERGICLRAHRRVLGQLGAELELCGPYDDRYVQPFDESVFQIGPFAIQAIPLPHSPGVPNFGFVIHCGSGPDQRKIVMATDFHAPGALAPHARDADFLFIEANHDPDLLRRYPNPSSAYHLSNPKTAELLCEVVTSSRRPPQAVMLGHLSRQRNDRTIALAAVEEAFRRRGMPLNFALHAAPLYEPSPIIEIT
jgi:phosphoribosyl 1,2-cyclic phosphodiesterase